ncbi:hypothetical protein SK128_011248 [Halocaridina rubra]|uniref:Uncharacterized protein n=1 Tax=Halocaridina rubra TaxID=373956 RepID=A0AAN8WSY2_HALRR
MKLILAVFCLASLASSNEAQEIGEEVQKNAKFFLISYSTVTWTFLSSFTSIIPYTCYTTAAVPVACQGRKRRRARKLTGDVSLRESQADLDSSVADIIPPQEVGGSDGSVEGKDPSQQERFFFTLWSTASTTVTVTAFSTNRAITISVSGLCTINGVALNIC